MDIKSQKLLQFLVLSSENNTRMAGIIWYVLRIIEGNSFFASIKLLVMDSIENITHNENMFHLIFHNSSNQIPSCFVWRSKLSTQVEGNCEEFNMPDSFQMLDQVILCTIEIIRLKW